MEAHFPDAAITLFSPNGTEMHYLAANEPEYVPGEVGWILIISGHDPPIAPQALSVQEVLEDLARLGVGDDAGLLAILLMHTEAMLEALRERACGVADPPAELVERIAALEEELAAIPGE